MATENDEAALLRLWNPELLGRYEDRWIAFRNGEVLASGEDFGAVAEPYVQDVIEGGGPLFAFVTFTARA
jgi:hypothetical protein